MIALSNAETLFVLREMSSTCICSWTSHKEVVEMLCRHNCPTSIADEGHRGLEVSVKLLNQDN